MLQSDEIQHLREEVSRLAQEHAEAEVRHARVVAELQQVVKAREEFIAIAAHELRNPMTPIIWEIDRLVVAARRPDSRVPEPIVTGLLRLERLIEAYIMRATTLLDVSRMVAGKHRLEIALVDASDVVSTTVERYTILAARTGCGLEASIESGMFGMLDRLAVEQIADNLLSNAIKYGAGHPIEVVLRSDGAAAELTVRDHGIGISETDRNRIFEPFERAVAGGEQSGFGIGLWLVRQLVEASGGSIAVSSAPGAGSTFTVTFPLVGKDDEC